MSPKIKAILMLQSFVLSYIFFSPWEQHIKPMMNLILMRQAHLDPSKHASCYWAFDWAWIFRSMWPRLGLEHDLGLGVGPRYKPWGGCITTS